MMSANEPSMKKAESQTSCNTNNKKKYKGVRMRSWGSWVSEIRAPNQKTRIWLGSYSTPEAAARAYDAALLCLKGSSASHQINFPLNASSYFHHLHHHHDLNIMMSPKSIQRVAASAANNTLLDHHNVMRSSTTTTPPPPPPSSSSPSEMLFDALTPANDDDDQNVTPMVMGNDPWLDFSPKYLDMMNGMFFDPSLMMISNIDDICYHDEGIIDLPLWS